ncbi:MAG: heavy-metal-associated domain-containing protein [Gemmataceae bacterium]|nr:heavy-metal-associated domain-containing protein [Gemmataceae bacterium]
MAKLVPSCLATAFAVILGAASPGPAAGEEPVKVELKGVHMCCPGCAKEAAAVVKKVDGVSAVATTQKERSVRFTAPDAKTAQKAVDALSAAGFHGEPTGKVVAFKDDSRVKAGKVASLTVTGFHNSCEGCVESFREAIKDVKGVTSDTAKEKDKTATVTGEFDAVELVKALNKAGFHVKVKD